MNTLSVVNEIQRLNSDWTDSQILDTLNNVVKLLIKRESDSSIYIDPTTGDLPYLTTTAGTFKYTITIAGVDIWKVRAIVMDPTATFSVDSNASYDRGFGNLKFNGRWYTQVPVRSLSEASGSVTVTFTNDPGTYSDKFRVMAYQSPADILSLSVDIPIDDRYRYSVVVPAVQSMIDGLDNGRYVEACQYIEETLVPKLDLDVDVSQIFISNYTY